MTAYEYVDGRGVHAAPPVGLAGAGTAAAPAALSGEAPRSFAGASGASSGVWEGLNPPYSTIVADPPWPYEDGCVALGPGHGELRASQPLPYSGMALADICALPVAALAARHCRLFLWTTNRYLRDAFDVLDAWGFKYRQALVWHKLDVNLRGSVAPNSAEFVYVATKGSPRRLDTMSSSVLATTRKGGHSAKPDAFGDLVEQVSPGPYVELFCRRPRLGWDSWGKGYELPEMVS